MIELRNEEKELLNKIVNDKYSIGSFSGMIFNNALLHPNKSTEELIQLALQVRLTISDMATESAFEVECEELPALD